MNIKQIYRNSIIPPKPLTEDEKKAQFVLNDERAKWLQHPITKDLLTFLETKKAMLMEEVVSMAYGEQEKIKARLHKAATIKEILEYARTISN